MGTIGLVFLISVVNRNICRYYGQKSVDIGMIFKAL